jgi:hypothetical protein
LRNVIVWMDVETDHRPLTFFLVCKTKRKKIMKISVWAMREILFRSNKVTEIYLPKWYLRFFEKVFGRKKSSEWEQKVQVMFELGINFFIYFWKKIFWKKRF